MNDKKVGRISLFTYMSIALAAAVLFFVVTIIGDYTWVARIGGSAWVFLLSLIISMPLVISYFKRRFKSV